MGWRTNGVLLLAVAGMASYLVLDRSIDEPPPKDPEQMTVKLLPKGAWGVRQIWFESRGREPIILDFDLANQRIMVSDPVKDLASAAVMKSIMDGYHGALLAQGYSAGELAADPSLLGRIGLESPKGRAEFRYGGDEVVKIAFGNLGVRDDEMYVRVGDAVYRTDPALFRLLDKNPDEMREHVLFNETLGAVRGFRFQKREGGIPIVYQAEYDARGEFQLIEPVRARADRRAVEDMIHGIGSLRVHRFLSGARPALTTSEPDYVVSMRGERGAETLEVRIVENNFVCHMKQRDIMFETTGKGLQALDPVLARLRDRRFHHLAEPAVDRIEIATGGGRPTLVLARGSDQRFAIQVPIRADRTNPTPLGELLHELMNLEARSFLPEPPGRRTGVEDGADFVSVKLLTQPHFGLNVAIRIGAPIKGDEGEESCYARREDETAVARVDRRIAELLRRPVTDYIDRNLPKMEVPAFSMRVHVPGRKAPIGYANRDGWREDGVDAEDDRVAEFVDAFRTLRAAGVVPAEQVPAAGEPVRVVLFGDQQAQGVKVYECSLLRDGEKGVLVSLATQSGFAYRVEQRVFRQLLDGWLGR